MTDWTYDGEGWWTPQVAFEDGPVLSQRCPSCGRFMARDSFASAVNGLDETFNSAHCSKCGDVDPVFLCWDGEGE